jgi:signal transduction histidine kinase
VRLLAALRATPRFDLVLVALLLVQSQLEAWAPESSFSGAEELLGPRWVNALVFLAAALAVLPRRRHPLGTVAALVVIGLAQSAAGAMSESFGDFVPWLIALYSAGRYAAVPRSLVPVPVFVVLGVVHDVRDPLVTSAEDVALFYVIALAAWASGHTVRRLRLRADGLANEAARLRSEREAHARAAVVEERRRIARELHDVVAHDLSVIVLQAQAAEAVLGEDGAAAQRPLERIEHSGREALTEMRALVTLLREDGRPVTRGSRPGLDDLTALVDRVRAAGVPIDLTVEGDRRPLEPGVDLTVYRIVQEAITNTLKHAGPAHVSVAVRHGDGRIELEVDDDGRRPAGRGPGGHGLAGMRERAALHGGTVEAGPRAGGGFSVRVSLPIAGPS